MLAWLSVWSEVHIVCSFAYGPADAAAIPKPVIFCLVEIQTGFIFLYWLTQVGIRSLSQECVCGSLKRKRREEYRCIVGDMVEEAKWKGLGVNDHWQQMKGIIMETAQDICGMTKGPPRHKETWWWNEEVAEAVRNMKIKYGKWKKENTEEARMEYKKTRQNAKRVISSAKKKETEGMGKRLK